ncbi:TIGR04222 domain-containing membrane protein [Candidatus Albibeggiatoa sp. nov. BB20]|uniref:TIGR04222 domain-containing membrane protein n=1 Tax=Candidatus Albibeggiatoa sp. nov. BB20 TaxID=3162723 RepID=UPI00336546BA
MLDFLLEMPMGEFLIYFGLFAMTCIAVGWFWVNADGSSQYKLPSEEELNSFELAALRDGRKGVIHTALFNLWHRGLLASDRNSANPKVQRVNVATDDPRGEIEDAIYQFTWTARRPAEFFTDATLCKKLDPLIRPINRKLEKMHLKFKEDHLDRASIAKFMVLALMFAAAGAKIYHSMFADEPFIFILAALVAAVVATHYLIKPSRNTRLGLIHVKKMQERFAWAKSENPDDGLDPALRVALYGISALSGITMFSSFQNTFATTDTIGAATGGYAGGGSGCGGGCGGGGS